MGFITYPVDYDVWYNGMVIASIKATTDAAALKLARKIYGKNVTVTKV